MKSAVLLYNNSQVEDVLIFTKIDLKRPEFDFSPLKH